MVRFLGNNGALYFLTDSEYRTLSNFVRKENNAIKSITNYIPTADPYLDRSFILEQLGISKEQDEINQKEYLKPDTSKGNLIKRG